MANIGNKAISILARNLIVGRSFTINLVKTLQQQLHFFHSCNTFLDAAKRILERLGIQTSLFVKI